MNDFFIFSKNRIYRILAMMVCYSLFLFAISMSPSHADPLERGVQGAIGGAIIGGIIDGGRGAGKGAIIGGTIGVIGGAIEEEEYRREYYDDDYYRYPSRSYRHYGHRSTSGHFEKQSEDGN